VANLTIPVSPHSAILAAVLTFWRLAGQSTTLTIYHEQFAATDLSLELDLLMLTERGASPRALHGPGQGEGRSADNQDGDSGSHAHEYCFTPFVGNSQPGPRAAR